MTDVVFIITRHVTNELTDRYWKESYTCVRKFYPHVKILIIDDNSPYKSSNNFALENCEIIQSEYHGRGELLPYYYFYKLKPAEKAVIIHDSVFLNSTIDYESVNTYKFLWSFQHHWDNDVMISNILNKFSYSSQVLDFYMQKNNWDGCFGAMSIITWNYINLINKRFNFFNVLLDIIVNREYRMCFERIIATVCTMLSCRNEAIYGDIHGWVLYTTNNVKSWNITYEEYEERKKISDYKIMKVWSGR